MGDWRLLTEEKPPKGEIWVATKTGDVSIVYSFGFDDPYLQRGDLHTSRVYDVTHWMPLETPEAPTLMEEQEDERKIHSEKR